MRLTTVHVINPVNHLQHRQKWLVEKDVSIYTVCYIHVYIYIYVYTCMRLCVCVCDKGERVKEAITVAYSIRPWVAGSEAWQLLFAASLLSVQKATLGSTGRRSQAQTVLQQHAVWVWRRRRFLKRFLKPESCFLQLVCCRFRKRRWAVRAAGPRPDPPFSSTLFGCGAGAVFWSLKAAFCS